MTWPGTDRGGAAVRQLRRRLRPLKQAGRATWTVVSPPLVGSRSLHDRPAGFHENVAVIAERARTLTERMPVAISGLAVPPIAVVAVYRRANVERLQSLIGASRARLSFWALDEASSGRVGQATVGAGVGTRFANLNRVLAQLSLADDEWLVIADDDVTFDRGTLNQAVALAAAAGLDVSQPSHSPASHLNWSVCRHRVGSVVRLTRFVDQGPILILSPLAQKLLLPFPEDLGMGWGVEAIWAQYSELRLGILDAVMIRHHVPVSNTSGAYDTREQWEQAKRLLAKSGTSWPDLQRELGRWNSGEAEPSWLARSA